MVIFGSMVIFWSIMKFSRQIFSLSKFCLAESKSSMYNSPKTRKKAFYKVHWLTEILLHIYSQFVLRNTKILWTFPWKRPWKYRIDHDSRWFFRSERANLVRIHQMRRLIWMRLCKYQVHDVFRTKSFGQACLNLQFNTIDYIFIIFNDILPNGIYSTPKLITSLLDWSTVMIDLPKVSFIILYL